MNKQTYQESLSVLIDRQLIGPRIWKLRFKNEKIALLAHPGQFVHVGVSAPGSLDPVLRRPISISYADKEEGWFEFIYREVGRGTQMLTDIPLGREVSAMGPLGKGFSMTGERPLMIGGGMGIAPLIFLAKKMSTKLGIIAMGGRGKDEVFWQDYFTDCCEEIKIATDDGSCGKLGNALCLLEGMESKIDHVYTCGPSGLMQAVAEWAKSHNIPCEVSMEKHMACGVGVCLSCACDTASGRQKICMNGPVFKAEEVYGYE